MLTYQPMITFGDVRASCVRDVPVYCRDHRCSHHVETNGWPDDVRLSDIEPNFTCTRCGKKAQRCGRSFRTPAWVTARQGSVGRLTDAPGIRSAFGPDKMNIGWREVSTNRTGNMATKSTGYGEGRATF